MAVVGYPLWFWGKGAVDPPKVSDSVAGLYVSLNPHITKTVFDFGDGTQITCRGSGVKWTPDVSSGQKSPGCGHVYQRPSLPKGKYTVTATTHWDVAWNANGDTGVLPFEQTASTTLAVGELQVLVR